MSSIIHKTNPRITVTQPCDVRVGARRNQSFNATFLELVESHRQIFQKEFIITKRFKADDSKKKELRASGIEIPTKKQAEQAAARQMEIVQLIIGQVKNQSPAGRFLKRTPNAQAWIELTLDQTLEFIRAWLLLTPDEAASLPQDALRIPVLKGGGGCKMLHEDVDCFLSIYHWCKVKNKASADLVKNMHSHFMYVNVLPIYDLNLVATKKKTERQYVSSIFSTQYSKFKTENSEYCRMIEKKRTPPLPKNAGPDSILWPVPPIQIEGIDSDTILRDFHRHGVPAELLAAEGNDVDDEPLHREDEAPKLKPDHDRDADVHPEGRRIMCEGTEAPTTLWDNLDPSSIPTSKTSPSIDTAPPAEDRKMPARQDESLPTFAGTNFDRPVEIAPPAVTPSAKSMSTFVGTVQTNEDGKTPKSLPISVGLHSIETTAVTEAVGFSAVPVEEEDGKHSSGHGTHYQRKAEEDCELAALPGVEKRHIGDVEASESEPERPCKSCKTGVESALGEPTMAHPPHQGCPSPSTSWTGSEQEAAAYFLEGEWSD